MPFSYAPGVNDIQSVDLEGVKRLVDAAKAAGVKHFIDTSFSGNIARHFPTQRRQAGGRKAPAGERLVYTILRPGYFMEVWLSPAVGFDAANAKATVYGAGDQPSPGSRLKTWPSLRSSAWLTGSAQLRVGAGRPDASARTR